MVGFSIDTDEYVLERAMEVVKDGGEDHRARCLANMPDTQAAALTAIKSLGQKTCYLERNLDTGVPLETYRRADNWGQWAFEKIPQLPCTSEARSSFQVK